MEKYKFSGKHLVAEYYDVDFENIATMDLVSEHIEEGIELSGATCLEIVRKKFEPMGYTIVAVLLESHVSIHAYPEHKAMFIDAFTCGDKEPLVIHNHLIKGLGVTNFKVEVISRGFDQNE
jgi:S-adenosylmethionine decarboxylase proenzyme